MAESATADTGFPEPDPWTVRLTIKNKEEVIIKKAGWFAGKVANATMSEADFANKVAGKMAELLPEKLKEKVGLGLTAEHVDTINNTCVLKFQINEIDFGALVAGGMDLSKEEGQAFGEMFEKLLKQFAAMGMPEKIPETRLIVSNKVRNNMMEKLETKIPEAMKEQDVLVDCEVPEIDRNFPKPVEEKMTALETPFILHASNIDRKKLLKANVNGPGKFAKRALAKSISKEKFNAKIAEKLTTEFPKAFKEKAGLGVKVIRLQEREKAEKAVVVQVIVHEYDIPGLIRMGKGEEFAGAFENILDIIKQFGSRFKIPGMQDKYDGILMTIQTKVRDSLKEKLSSTLSEKLFCDCVAED